MNVAQVIVARLHGVTSGAEPKETAGSLEGSHERAEAALNTESDPEAVAAIQRSIIAGLKRGRIFSTVHKEGGTNIFWKDGAFVRSDYGDCPDHREFTDEAESLSMLRQFWYWDVVRGAGKDQLPELQLWKQIRRRFRSR